MPRLLAGNVYIGIKTTVMALDRKTGIERWRVKLPVKYPSSSASGLANVWHDGDALFASAAGEVFCLDPKSGTILWHNLLKKLGTGFVSIATEHGGPRSSAPGAAGSAAVIAATHAAAAS
jgi:outer membrane protein assembly factor BamB